ncbi:MAG TPA: hypothetical protein PKD79_03845, partial [Candidatus Doudnabacteria bacterium]|nr:hypothetical protein [Candidatus Doudnabacteria bacterium]
MTILKKLSVWVVTLALVAAFLPLFNALPSGLSERWEPNKVAHADDKGDGGSSLFGGSLSLSPNDGVAVRMQHNSSFQFVALYNLNGAVYDVSSYATWTIDGLSPAMYNLIGGHLTVYHLDSGSGTITAQFDGQSHSLFIEFLEPFPSQPTACMAGYGGLTAMNPGQSTTQAFYWSFDPPYIGNGVALFEVGSGAQGHVLTSKQPSSNDNGWAMSVAGNANYGVKRLPVLVDIQSDDYTGVYGCNDISIYVPAPDWSTAPIFNFMCDTVSQSVARGQTANFLLSGNPSGTYSSQLSVTMASNPAGPVMNPTPVLLNPGNGYLGVASVPTGASTPAGTYTLTFTATDGVSSQECESELVILPITGSATLLFDNSPGPTTPTPPNGTTGVLSWTTANAASCSGSMAQGVDTTTPSPWTGPKAAANSGAQTFNVNNLQPNTTYIFRIDCVTSFGDPIEPDTVTVNVGAAQTPTATLQCQGAESKDPHAGPCEVAYDSAALLVWSSEYATSCSITPGSWGSSTAGSGSTPNLTSNIQYSLSCTGPGGTSEPSTVEISVITDHNYNFDLSVYSDTQSQGNTSITNLIVSNPIHGFNAPVTMSVQSISPAGLPLSNVTFNNNPTNSPYGTPVTAVIQTAGVPLNTYTITFRSDGGTSYDPKTRTF